MMLPGVVRPSQSVWEATASLGGLTLTVWVKEVGKGLEHKV